MDSSADEQNSDHRAPKASARSQTRAELHKPKGRTANRTAKAKAAPRKPKQVKPKTKNLKSLDGFCLACPLPCYRRFPRCDTHKNIVAVCKYQSQNDPNDAATFEELIAEEQSAVQLVKEAESQFAGIAKYKNKKFLNFARVRRIIGLRRSRQEIEQEVPYEREEWIEEMMVRKKWRRKDCEHIWDSWKNQENTMWAIN